MVMLLDTSAWIEFFRGTEKGEIVEKVLEKEKTFTSIVSLGEVAHWCLKHRLENRIGEYINGIKQASTILEVNQDVVMAAGKINFERKKTVKSWDMVDSIILATGSLYSLKILTRDIHFKGVHSVHLL